MAKLIKINPADEFVLHDTVFTYSVKDNSIELKRVGKYEGKSKIVKTKKQPPTLEMCYEWFPDFPKDYVKKAWTHYQDGMNDKGEWTDRNGDVVINHKQKMRTNWMRDEYRIKETKTEDNSEMAM